MIEHNILCVYYFYFLSLYYYIKVWKVVKQRNRRKNFLSQWSSWALAIFCDFVLNYFYITILVYMTIWRNGLKLWKCKIQKYWNIKVSRSCHLKKMYDIYSYLVHNTKICTIKFSWKISYITFWYSTIQNLENLTILKKHKNYLCPEIKTQFTFNSVEETQKLLLPWIKDTMYL